MGMYQRALAMYYKDGGRKCMVSQAKGCVLVVLSAFAQTVLERGSMGCMTFLPLSHTCPCLAPSHLVEGPPPILPSCEWACLLFPTPNPAMTQRNPVPLH